MMKTLRCMMHNIHQVTIVSREPIARNMFEMAIRVSSPDFHFAAGQYIWLILPALFYDDQKGARRAFSIASAPKKGEPFKIIVRASDSGYHKTLREIPIAVRKCLSAARRVRRFP